MKGSMDRKSHPSLKGSPIRGNRGSCLRSLSTDDHMKPSSSTGEKQIHLAVHGTWMRRLEFIRNLLDAGVVFKDESQTAAIDRL